MARARRPRLRPASRSGSRSRRGSRAGPSDAAATLDAALEAWGAELDPDARLRVAAQLGSDVPFFGVGGPALVEGRGERVAAAARPARDAGGPARDAARRRSRRTRSSPRSTRCGASVTARSGMSSVHLAEELRSGLSAADLVARAGVLAVANDLLPGDGRGPARDSCRSAVPSTAFSGAHSVCRAPVRPSGRSMLPRPTRPPRPTWSGRACATGRSTPPGDAEPFVTATSIVTQPAEEEPTT